MPTPAITQALETFRAGPAALAASVAGAGADELAFHPAPGKWNIRQILRHVADTEMVAGMRIRQLAAEHRPTLIAFDHDAWADQLDYAVADVAEALNTLRTIREDTARLLERLPDEAYDRVGVHSQLGERTLLFLVEHFGNHVMKHGGQIAAIRTAWAKR